MAAGGGHGRGGAAGTGSRDSGSRGRKPEPETPRAFRRLNAAIVVIFVLVGIVLLPDLAPRRRPAPRRRRASCSTRRPGSPAKLREIAKPGDRVFNPQEWGSWFEFTLPDLPVAMDSRIEFYPPQVWRDYSGVIAGSDGWEQRIASWDPTIAVMAKRDQAVVDRFAKLGWKSGLHGRGRHDHGRAGPLAAARRRRPVRRRAGPSTGGVTTHRTASIGRMTGAMT